MRYLGDCAGGGNRRRNMELRAIVAGPRCRLLGAEHFEIDFHILLLNPLNKMKI
jgi:hypothetical protein